ncbi:MAG: hypothetical protein ACLP07_01810, partial [Terracidiphilus sp.]
MIPILEDIKEEEMPIASSELRLADRIWLAVAALHQLHPHSVAFNRTDIRDQLDKSGLGNGTNPLSVNAHLKQHLVANA